VHRQRLSHAKGTVPAPDLEINLDVPGNRLYRVTERGHRVMGLAIRFRLLDFP